MGFSLSGNLLEDFVIVYYNMCDMSSANKVSSSRLNAKLLKSLHWFKFYEIPFSL